MYNNSYERYLVMFTSNQKDYFNNLDEQEVLSKCNDDVKMMLSAIESELLSIGLENEAFEISSDIEEPPGQIICANAKVPSGWAVQRTIHDWHPCPSMPGKAIYYLNDPNWKGNDFIICACSPIPPGWSFNRNVGDWWICNFKGPNNCKMNGIVITRNHPR